MSMVVRAMVSVVGEACSVAISLTAGRIHGSHARPYYMKVPLMAWIRAVP